MTGSQTPARRVVFLDGYAGRGRHVDGSPASAERILKIAQDQYARVGLGWTCFFVEKDRTSAEVLSNVVDEYAASGMDVRAHQGDVKEVLDSVVTTATGCPLFLFLDPCGLGLPYEVLVGLLTRKRREDWPPTEVLLNFSLVAVRRIGGLVASPGGNEASMRRLDEAVGGDWWRRYFLGGVTDEAVAAVVELFCRDLSRDTQMNIVFVPVRRAPTHRTLYHLVFGTRRQHGLWVFGDSVARAMQAWWDTLEEVESEQDPDALFTRSSMVRPSLDDGEAKATPVVAENLARLLDLYPQFRVVDHTVAVLGDYYGQVREVVVRRAIKLLHDQGRTASDGRGPRVRDLVVPRSSR